MERMTFTFEGKGRSPRRGHALAGVVGSGNLEVLLEGADLDGRVEAVVSTAIGGYGTLWERVLADFVERHRLANVRISVNDGGATPAIVTLRLDQAAAEIMDADR